MEVGSEGLMTLFSALLRERFNIPGHYLVLVCVYVWMKTTTWQTSLSLSSDAPTTTQTSSRTGGRWSAITDISPETLLDLFSWGPEDQLQPTGQPLRVTERKKDPDINIHCISKMKPQHQRVVVPAHYHCQCSQISTSKDPLWSQDYSKNQCLNSFSSIIIATWLPQNQNWSLIWYYEITDYMF